MTPFTSNFATSCLWFSEVEQQRSARLSSIFLLLALVISIQNLLASHDQAPNIVIKTYFFRDPG
jgi:hypothetical protein